MRCRGIDGLLCEFVHTFDELLAHVLAQRGGHKFHAGQVPVGAIDQRVALPGERMRSAHARPSEGIYYRTSVSVTSRRTKDDSGSVQHYCAAA